MALAKNKPNSFGTQLHKSPTGISGLDEITKGGLPEGPPTLVCGDAGCAMDLSEHKRLEEALGRLNADQEKRVEDPTAELEKINETLKAEIVERKRAEEELRKSETKYHVVANNTYDFEFWINPQGQYIYASPSCKRIAGYNAEDFAKDPDLLRRIIHPDDRAILDRHTEDDEKKHKDSEIEFRIIHADGSIRWISHACQPVLSDEGEYLGVRGRNRDISIRKRAEEMLVESEKRVRLQLAEIEAIYQSAYIGLCVLDRELHYLRINNRLAEINGISAADHLGKKVGDVVPFVASLVEDIARQVFDTGQPVLNVEASGTTRVHAGEQRFVISHFLPLKNEAGKVMAINVAVEEITERKRIEAALRQRTLELQQINETLDQKVQERTDELQIANKTLRELSSSLLSAQEEERKRIAADIHDSLGSTLSHIKMMMTGILEKVDKESGPDITEALKSIVPVIQESIDECRRLQMDLRPPILDDLGIVPALSWFCRRFNTICPGVRIEQKIDIKEDEVPDLLKIVIFRITQEGMNNVIKYSRANLISLSLNGEDENIELVIRDNGIGFNMEEMLAKEISRRGLGLESMRERTLLSGGSFTIQSAQGKGTVIRASWPARLHQRQRKRSWRSSAVGSRKLTQPQSRSFSK